MSNDVANFLSSNLLNKTPETDPKKALKTSLFHNEYNY